MSYHKRLTCLPVIMIILIGLAIWPTRPSEPDVAAAQAASSISEADTQFVEGTNQERYRILLKSRQFTPPADLSEGLAALTATGSESRHMLVQLDHIPDEAEKDALAKTGIRLLAYVPNHAWFGRVELDVALASTELRLVRWLGQIRLEDKAPAEVLAGAFAEWSRVTSPPGGVRLVVEFFADVALAVGQGLIADEGGIVEAVVDDIHAMVVVLPEDALVRLLNRDEVQWVESVGPALSVLNDDARRCARVDLVQAAPYNLTGRGVTALIYDGGMVDSTHQDFAGRITMSSEGTAPVADHATHVAGTFGADGSAGGASRPWRGMAIGASILTDDYDSGAGTYFFYNQPGSIAEDYAEAVRRDAIIVNNSIGMNLCKNYGKAHVALYGDYETTAQLLDNVASGHWAEDQPLTLIYSAGNERTWTACSHWFNTAGHRTIATPATAKNIIVVGAVNSDNEAITDFSSFGPLDDGRLKPDVVAPGAQSGDAGVVSTMANNLVKDDLMNGVCPPQGPHDNVDDFFVPYTNSVGPQGEAAACEDTWEGTSMAAPVVTGIGALLIEQYRDIYNNAEPWPSTIKALLVQSARDLDDGAAGPLNPGPDYASGYGLVDAKAAVDLVRARALRQETVSQGETDSYDVWIPTGATQFKATLAWDDPAGTANANTALVNDLDIVLIGPTTTHFPWTLVPDHPEADALRGRDGVNNLEQVLVTNPVSGKWTIRINGFGVPQAPQQYSIVSEALFDILKPGISEQVYAGSAASPQKFVIQTTKPRDGLVANQFQVTVGGQPANVLTVYEGSDKYVLEVMPTAVPANGSYDLSVLIPTALVWNVKERAVLFADTANVDAVLVIDRSGSMSTANKMNAAKDAAKQFVDLMQVNDMVGVVSFDDIIETNFVLTSIDGQSSVKTGAKGAIDALYSRGTTSIGGGLQRGQEQLLTRGQTNHPWAIVLLSDGLENTAPFVSNVLPAIKASKTTVHTVGLGSDADEALMLDIASQTRGTYSFAPTPQELAGIYNAIAGAVANRQTLLSATGMAQQGVTDQKDVVVDSTVSDATFSISWSNSSSTIDLALHKPNGQIIDPTVAANDPNAEYVAGSTYRYYRIARPTLTTGVWQLLITGGPVAMTRQKEATASPASEGYTARVSAQTALTARFYLDRNSYLTTEPIKMVVTLSDQQPIRGAMVQVFAQPPSQAAVAIRSGAWIDANGDTIPDPVKVTELNERYAQAATTITLYDDGLHGDGLAQDGVYANTFINTYRTGTWMFSASASGASNGGEAFVRYAEISTYIAQNPNPRIRQIYLPLITRNLESGVWRASNLTGRIVYDLASTPTSCTALFAATDSGAFRSTDSGASWQPLNVGVAEKPAVGTMIFDNLLSPEANLTPAVVACSANPNIVYLTQWGSGVYRSTNGGNNWEPRNNGLADPWVYDLAVDPNNCNVVYAAGNSQGVFKSSDGGASWQARNAGLGNLLTRAIAVAPNNPNRLYVGATAGVYRSDNAATTWTTTAGLPGATVWGLAAAQNNADLVYASVYGYGIYKSVNGGGAWLAQNQGLSNLKVRALTVDPAAPQTIYVGLEDNAGVYRSVDGASNWAEFNNGLTSRTIKALWLDGGACRRLHAGTTDGAWYIAP